MFGVSLVEGKSRKSMIQPFVEMGLSYSEQGVFRKDKVSKFAEPE